MPSKIETLIDMVTHHREDGLVHWVRLNIDRETGMYALHVNDGDAGGVAFFTLKTLREFMYELEIEVSRADPGVE